MASPHHVVIELYVLLSVINAFLGVGTGIYQMAEPDSSLRSPFNGAPLGDQFTQLDTNTVIDDITIPVNSTGGIIGWVQNGIADFTATINIVLEFSKFLTAGYLIDLISTIGFPAEWVYLVTVPFAIYVMFTIFTMVTNRLTG